MTEFPREFIRNHPAGRGNVMYQMQQVLNRQHDLGRGRSRHQDKKNSGHAQYNKIYAHESWRKHKSSIAQFGHWLRAEGVKTFWDVKPEHVQQFLLEQSEDGKSYKTITGYQTAINHVFHGSGRTDHDIYSAYQLGIDGVRERQNNLFENIREVPDKHVPQRELVQMTGLRRSELNRVGTKSFYRHKDDYYVCTLGKGGRPRYSKVLDEYEDVFKKRYSNYVIEVESRKDIPQTKEAIQEVYRTQKEIYPNKIASHYSLHVYRAEYAQNLYKELSETSKYTPRGVEYEINGYSGDEGLFAEISKNLGHVRVADDLMNAYLRHK